MSEIFKKEPDRELAHYVKCENGSIYYVDSVELYGYAESGLDAFETGVFECDDNCEVVDWGGVFEHRYSTKY